jgi:bifunctional diaminopimelate decarboxylase / aspartate kinase
MSASPLVDRWIVLKFGGTSVSRRHRWDTIGKLAKKRAEETGSRVLVVVSALSGVTNELTAIADGAPDSRDRVAALVERHEGFLVELGLGREVLAERLAALQGLLDDARAATRPLDWQADVLGQGELLSSTLGAAYLHASGLDMGWMDARQWLDAMPPQPNQSDWSQRLSVNCQWRADAEWMQRFRAQPTRLLITQGFISRHADGGTAILGRGGSDTSAAYFGALLGASRVEIWTDVPGMFSANPKDVPDARLLTRLDYYEAQEIATTGAKVLHPRSIKPCRDAGVPMAILDTERPELPGTSIDGSAAPVPGVKAISRRNGIVLVSMEGIGMWQQAIGIGFVDDEGQVQVVGRLRDHVHALARWPRSSRSTSATTRSRPTATRPSFSCWKRRASAWSACRTASSSMCSSTCRSCRRGACCSLPASARAASTRRRSPWA